MTDEQTKALAVIYSSLGKDPTTFADPMAPKFFDELGADSLDVVEISMELEDAFGIDISDAEAATWGDRDAGPTVGDIWRVIEPKLADLNGGAA